MNVAVGMANDRLRALEDVEKEIASVLQSAGTIVLELSKEKANASLLDRQLNQFQTSINRVESELSAQIRYLTQVCVCSHLSIYLSVILSIVLSFIYLCMLYICIKQNWRKPSTASVM
uniref:Mediator of RNA polymerase II transcription subunit 11 n=1 Tax=Cyprinus carpio carpio TaxID=630221 RepID=A0A9J8D193_CYPCA